VVMNRIGGEDSEITLEKAQETIGRPIYWQVPNDYKAMLGARNAGVPLLTHAPKSKAHSSLLNLANDLCGKTAAPAKKERRSFFSFR
jgi:pilus assembly protein CpaE